jgi:hypothetical protein
MTKIIAPVENGQPQLPLQYRNWRPARKDEGDNS